MWVFAGMMILLTFFSFFPHHGGRPSPLGGRFPRERHVILVPTFVSAAVLASRVIFVFFDSKQTEMTARSVVTQGKINR
jgi:hypothetical protein